MARPACTLLSGQAGRLLVCLFFWLRQRHGLFQEEGNQTQHKRVVAMLTTPARRHTSLCPRPFQTPGTLPKHAPHSAGRCGASEVRPLPLPATRVSGLNATPPSVHLARHTHRPSAAPPPSPACSHDRPPPALRPPPVHSWCGTVSAQGCERLTSTTGAYIDLSPLRKEVGDGSYKAVNSVDEHDYFLNVCGGLNTMCACPLQLSMRRAVFCCVVVPEM